MNTKPSQHRLSDYLDHMLNAIKLALSYVEGLEKEEFLDDNKTQQAVVLNILVLGEAAAKLVNEYPEFVAAHTEMPWAQMRGMRNRMAHGYFKIDMDIVWETVMKDLPPLVEALKVTLPTDQ